MGIQETIFSTVDQLMPEILEIADFLHENPEVSHEEFQACRMLVEYLQAKGFRCEEKIAGFETSFFARAGEQRRPAVAFISEYDALPELGHACGHNMIAASAVGAAAALNQVAFELAGQIAVIGCPAEEVPHPPVKKIMLDEGIFDGIDVAIMMHGGDRTTTGYNSLANTAVEFSFKGKPTHASKYPHLGRSALDGALFTMNAIEFLREHVRQDVRIHGVVVDGGARPNIVPETAKLAYRLRALDRKYLDEIEERFFNCARAGALASRCEVLIDVVGRNANKILTPILEELLLENAVKAGAMNVMEPEEEKGSTDFGNVSQRIPCSTLKTAFVPKGTPGHTKEWTQAAAGPEARKAIEVASKALALTAYQLLTDEDLMQKVKFQYKERNSL
jgi:amidohydrolase